MAEEFNSAQRVEDMVKAIRYKSNFISEQLTRQAQDVYDVEKNKILDTEKTKIYEKLASDRSQYASSKKIEKSRLCNDLRLSKMSQRSSLLENLKLDIRRELERRVQNKEEYKKLLKNLIVQAMVKLMEAEVELQCLKGDVPLVEGILVDCQNEFNQLLQRECHKTVNSKIKLNKDHFLDDKHKNLIGGIVLSCHFGKITVSNTIDSRIDFAFQEMLPEIREGLYPDPVRAAIDAKRKKEQLDALEISAKKAH